VSRRFYCGDVGDPKTENGIRTVTLTPDMTQALWRLRAETRAGDDELVFTSETGRRIQPSNLTSRVLKPALKAAGLEERISFHTFRHTTGSLLYDEGYDDVKVQHWLGHANPSFTKDVYVHPVAAEPAAAAPAAGPAPRAVVTIPEAAPAEPTDLPVAPPSNTDGESGVSQRKAS